MNKFPEQTYQRLINSYGDEFLRYVLNLPIEGSIMELIEARTDPSAVALLLDAMNQAPWSGNGELDVMLYSSSAFAQFRADFGGSLANYLRLQCGGEVADASPSDGPVVHALSIVARDLWPVLLLKPPTQGPRTFWMSTTPGLFSHPETPQAAKAFMADAELTKLFPDAESIDHVETMGQEILAIQSNWMMSTGQGGSRQLISVLDGIVFHASVLARLDGSALTQARLMDSIEESVNTFRQLAAGHEVEVPAFIGFSGVRMAEGTSLSFGDDQLREMLPVEQELLLNQTDRITSVYTTQFPIQLLKIYPQSLPSDDQFLKEWRKLGPRIEESYRALQRRIDRVRLGLLLASTSKGELLATGEVSRYIADPTQPGGSSSWETDARAPASYELTQPLGKEAVRWHKLVLDKHPESLNIAMKRLLGAVSQRWDAADAFIDAVIVWENAFGTQQETTFRVTASIAKLLEPGSTDDRLKLQTELKKLYSARSMLVHGSKEPKPEVAWAQKERAIEIALQLLRTLYAERPDLLELTSEERGAQLLLEG
ncbi:HEPN domain-containing protein [Curtobacterium sp. MWU13-2055]|uniref:HEPN domain-containing protein n=1 Tax=Curtobacterium sp. MWU13-2055 TaxID=2931928 RepID=UPI00200EA640|nr:HEPN domain-containing protein [Curtobacterium sp. MWU13-2055]